MSTIYFTSDQHFGHQAIIKHSNRPFSSVEEMNEILIQNHNKIVTNKDDVYFLGDFSFYKDFNKIKEIIKRYNGRKYLIYGNHDKEFRKKYLEVFKSCNDYLEINYNKIKICMMHFPITSWNKMKYGSWHLHGHTHGKIQESNNVFIKDNFYRWDVGVDCNNYKPISFEELKNKFNGKDNS